MYWSVPVTMYSVAPSAAASVVGTINHWAVPVVWAWRSPVPSTDVKLRKRRVVKAEQVGAVVAGGVGNLDLNEDVFQRCADVPFFQFQCRFKGVSRDDRFLSQSQADRGAHSLGVAQFRHRCLEGVRSLPKAVQNRGVALIRGGQVDRLRGVPFVEPDLRVNEVGVVPVRKIGQGNVALTPVIPGAVSSDRSFGSTSARIDSRRRPRRRVSRRVRQY